MRQIDADALKIGLEYDGQLSPYLGKMIDACPTVQKWHSVEDELPEPDEEVLIYAKGLENENDGVITVSHYTHHKYGFSIKGWVAPWQYFESNYRITHWIELPKPPKEDEP